MRVRRSHKQDRLAKLYDAEILPLWSERFGRMLLRGLSLPPKAMVLDVGAGTGYPALQIVRRMDDASRVVSIDPAGALLDVAREKAGALGGKRIFFRTESAEPRLSFGDEVFDRVVANLTLSELERPSLAVADFARVCVPGGSVHATLPLGGTWVEFLDLLREVLIQEDRPEALVRLDRYQQRLPSAARLRAWFERAGLVDVNVATDEFQLVFRSSREFFFAPVIEYGPLAEWKEIAGKGDEMQGVFRAVKEAIDAYFGGSSFAVTVRAGCVSGRKPLEEERRASLALPVELDLGAAANGGEVFLGTGEIEILADSVISGPPGDDDELLDEEVEEELDVGLKRR